MPIHCEGKERFTSYAEADRIALRGRRRQESNRHPYKCGHCNGFHIGSQTGRKRRRPHADEAFA